jgi:hypothetical protein
VTATIKVAQLVLKTFAGLWVSRGGSSAVSATSHAQTVLRKRKSGGAECYEPVTDQKLFVSEWTTIDNELYVINEC